VTNKCGRCLLHRFRSFGRTIELKHRRKELRLDQGNLMRRCVIGMCCWKTPTVFPVPLVLTCLSAR
jgi:hypothetical protein